MSLRNDLLSMVERWACTDGRPPNEAENERRKCARELERYVRRNVPPEAAPPAPSAVAPATCTCGVVGVKAQHAAACPAFMRAPSAVAPATPDPAPIHWLGDATQDCDVWELTRRRERFTMLGGPTTLYFKMDDGTRLVVPSGWWIYDWHTEHPRVSSAAPSAVETPPAPDPVAALQAIDEHTARTGAAPLTVPAVAPTDEGARTCSGCSHFAAKGEPTGAGICDAFPMNDPTHGTVHALAYGFEYVDGCDRFAPRGGQGGKT